MAQSTSTGSGTASRTLFALIGAGLMILGAFQDWIRHIPGTEVGAQILVRHVVKHPATVVNSVGFLAIVLGLGAIVGLATSGWLTRLSGALGIVLFVLLLVQLYAGTTQLLPGVGPWLVMVGGVVSVAGGS